jgi:hypothetical protein
VSPLVPPLVSWLRESWPGYDWARADVRASCFHDVAILAPAVVARVARHGARAARVRRQHGVLEALAGARLPFAVPRNASGVVTGAGRAGMLTTWVPGESRPDVPWAALAGPVAGVLRALAGVDVAALPRRLPPPRAHRASLVLQLAAAAELLGAAALREHALGNFVARARAGTLYDPGRRAPPGLVARYALGTG